MQHIFRTKSKMVEAVVNKLIEWKNNNKEVQNVRIDKAKKMLNYLRRSSHYIII